MRTKKEHAPRLVKPERKPALVSVAVSVTTEALRFSKPLKTLVGVRVR